MYRIGISTNDKLICEELFADCQRSGVDVMEISLGLEDTNALDFDMLAELSQKYGIELWSFHFPFMPFSVLDISNSELAESTVSYYEELMKKATAIGIRNFVLHPSGEPIPSEKRAEKIATAKKSLASLAEIANKYGAVIAVEDLPRSCLGNCSAEIAELIGAHSALRVCFDTNHLLGESLTDFVQALGDKIITTHVSDYDFVNERHWLPGEGKVDWQELLQSLRNVGYSGPWLYEVSFRATNTIKRERLLSCEDMVKNAKELFEGKELTVLPFTKTV